MDRLLQDAAALLDALRSKKWQEGRRHLPNCRIGSGGGAGGLWETV